MLIRVLSAELGIGGLGTGDWGLGTGDWGLEKNFPNPPVPNT
ncbi:MAG: hypothetical protein V7L11_32315 [Nostoc sp.]